MVKTKLKIGIEVCRVCMSNDCKTSIFGDQNLLEKFLFITQLEATPQDGLPTLLCDKCIARLKIAFDFKKQSYTSDVHFRQFIERVNSQFNEIVQEDTIVDNTEAELLMAAGFDASKSQRSNIVDDGMKSPLGITGPTQSISFMRGVKIQPQSTAKTLMSVPQIVEEVHHTQIPEEQSVVDQHIAKIEVYDDDDENDHEEEQIEETLEEYQTTMGQPMADYTQRVVYISLGEKNEFSFEEAPEGTIIESQEQNPEQSRVQTRSNTTKNTSQESENGDKSIKSHFCTQCNKGFSTKTNLWRHTATHGGNRPYQCTMCGKGFTQNGSLKQHMLLHTGEKPYKCNVCERAFTQAKSLTFHMRRHTGEKPFTCDKCGVSFRQKDGMKRHVLLKHSSKEQPREIFSCEVCKKVLFSRYSLSNHKRKHNVKEEPTTTTTTETDAVVVSCIS